MMEAWWKMYELAHAVCFEFFTESYRMFHLYAQAFMDTWSEALRLRMYFLKYKILTLLNNKLIHRISNEWIVSGDIKFNWTSFGKEFSDLSMNFISLTWIDAMKLLSDKQVYLTDNTFLPYLRESDFTEVKLLAYFIDCNQTVSVKINWLLICE